MRKEQLGIAAALPWQRSSRTAPYLLSKVQRAAKSEMPTLDHDFVRLEIHADKAALVIPVCGGEDETHFLCAGAAFLQVSTRGAWRPATVRKGLAATLGALPKSTWKAHRIEIGNTAYFDFTFSPELLDVQRGQKLRVLVDSWTSEGAIQDRDSEKRLTVRTIDCP